MDGSFTRPAASPWGPPLAPALATIVVADIEETYLRERALKPSLWLRYINDVFGVWAHSAAELDSFLEGLNDRKLRIRFTCDRSTRGQIRSVSQRDHRTCPATPFGVLPSSKLLGL